ncbi:conserved hypothetical protein [Ixodes scapularis]|uniref:Large subunit GTPase 1 homolog n=1 Tax=Ixodes scapularis TaxID=6945 RepID=B7PE42_IXOSC|nr:conserved hypothetical protein [Ixodes scapularis]|eukprot:XP_002399945.1 conserved hypothetical protein [Ixodes scapularis]
MGKKKGASGLGRCLIKQKPTSRLYDSSLHTTELNDGYDWGRANVTSITEQNDLDAFLATAELAGIDFTAEKQKVKVVHKGDVVSSGILSDGQKAALKSLHEEHKELLRIPRRPPWNSDTSAEELHALERESFVSWRRQLAELQDVEGIILTPYEKNLEFWRQLWRVVERSDVVVQIVDARNPLLFHCGDLERYVTELDPLKQNLLILNKADYLNRKQREEWAKYLKSVGLQAVFFSALEQGKATHESDESETGSSPNPSPEPSPDSSPERSEGRDHSTGGNYLFRAPVLSTYSLECIPVGVNNYYLNGSHFSLHFSDRFEDPSRLYTKEELLELFRTTHPHSKATKGQTVVGLVGYPNVGKSSTINALLSHKKVSVSTTPGKTKHFQTLQLEEGLWLCDCPGLVFPNFVSSKAEMIVHGILPIDQMTDHVPPVSLISFPRRLIPRHVLEATYGIMIPRPHETEDPDRAPTSEELLNAYGYMRGYMTQSGVPDNPRASRYVLRDFVTGRLLYCMAPPGVKQDDYHQFPPPTKASRPEPAQANRAQEKRVTSKDIDRDFFQKVRHANVSWTGWCRSRALHY